MAQTSQKIQNPPQIKHYVAELFIALTRLSPSQLMLLYGDLFTENESVMLAKRLEIAKSLLAGKSYLRIQKQLGVTANTVSQIQKVLKNAGTGFRVAATLPTFLKESKPLLEAKPSPTLNQPLVVPLPRARKTFLGGTWSKLFTVQNNSDKF